MPLSVVTHRRIACGMGYIYPIGGLGLLAGVESLIWLLSIGWSTSFLVLEMREFRSLERRASLVEEINAGIGGETVVTPPSGRAC